MFSTTHSSPPRRQTHGAAAFVLLALLALPAVAACTYEPPNAADRDKPTYQADLAECQAFGDKEGHRRVLAYGGLFLTYPISLPVEEWRQTRKCMTGKGYTANG
jgi:hypothetical protein